MDGANNNVEIPVLTITMDNNEHNNNEEAGLELRINEDDNEEEAPIDFGIEQTERLTSYRKDGPPAPRNLPKKTRCCNIL